MSTRSLIAEANALFRMAEAWLPAEQRLLDDPFAARLGQGDPLIWVIRGLRRVIPPLGRTIEQLRTAHCVRHASIDALLRQSQVRGTRQFIILGAGYDMRASRLGLEGERWFELDRPDVLARKERRLVGVEGVNGAVSRIAADLAEPIPVEKLRARGWNPDEATCFVLEGVLHYLPPAVVARIFVEVGGGEGARELILSFIQDNMVKRAPGTLLWLFRATREVPRTFLGPGEIEAMGKGVGLDRFAWWDYAGQVREFVPQGAGRMVGVSQDVAVVRRG